MCVTGDHGDHLVVADALHGAGRVVRPGQQLLRRHRRPVFTYV